MPPDQLTFDLDHVVGYRREDFLPAASNEAALAWITRWPDWPVPVLVLYGPDGCGKTHLARIWTAQAEARWCLGAEIGRGDVADLFDPAGSCAVDDGEQADEKTLFHLHNAVVASRSYLLLTATRPPAAWKVGLPDLRSRLRAAASIAVDAPDDSLLAAVLVKQFADRQVRVDNALISYLVARIERSFSAAREVVARLDAASLQSGRPITLPLARATLALDDESAIATTDRE